MPGYLAICYLIKGENVCTEAKLRQRFIRISCIFTVWTAISIVMGTVCGLIGTAFGYGVIYAQRLF